MTLREMKISATDSAQTIGGKTLSYMVFPNNRDDRQWFMELWQAWQRPEPLESVVRHFEDQRQGFQEYYDRGQAAGEILTTMLRAHRNDPPYKISLRRATDLIIEKSQVGTSRGSLEKWWAEYRPVAHYWAAMEIQPDDKWFEKEPAKLHTVALGHLDIGCRIRLDNRRTKTEKWLLDPQSAWYPPPDLEFIPYWFELTSLTPEEIEVLENYSVERAESR